jgi:hypothetical protein
MLIMSMIIITSNVADIRISVHIVLHMQIVLLSKKIAIKFIQ